ncbi:MAG: ATP-dependent protease [Candidatus Methanoperedens sp.]|nr:ATP-dependent protease [Candidatus Methanoperedens sp.]
MKSKILAVLLIISILGNIYFLFLAQPAQKDLQELENRTNYLEKANADLSMQVNQDNVSERNYISQLEIYRQRVAYLERNLNNTPTNIQGFAALQAPAVMQRIEYIQDYPFVRQQVVEEGSLINMSVEIRPGEGRVLVQTKPLMGTVFQDTANTAVYVAQNKTGMQLSGSDVIFSIESQKELPSVDGPSAGALMTLLVISALEKKEVKNDVTLTGTIDQYGHVGAIGGVIEKAKAAKEGGKTLFLLSRENNELVQYKETRRNIAGMTIIQQVPETIDARQYVEANVGIKIEYVDNIDDVLKYAT